MQNQFGIAVGLRASLKDQVAGNRGPNIAKLKADAQKVVSIVGGDKAKIQTYCQINYLGEQSARLMRSKTKRKLRHCPRK
jgi:hypothetical protein